MSGFYTGFDLYWCLNCLGLFWGRYPGTAPWGSGFRTVIPKFPTGLVPGFTTRVLTVNLCLTYLGLVLGGDYPGNSARGGSGFRTVIRVPRCPVYTGLTVLCLTIGLFGEHSPGQRRGVGLDSNPSSTLSGLHRFDCIVFNYWAVWGDTRTAPWGRFRQ